MRGMIVWVILTLMAGCNLNDRGLSKLQIAEDLRLGVNLDDIQQQWFLYSSKPLLVDQTMSSDSELVYRGVSRDPIVTGFYLFFNSKTKILQQIEWRYPSSMTEAKENDLVDYWTKKLWTPSCHQRWEGKVYVWNDRKAQLQIYLADGICHLIQKLN